MNNVATIRQGEEFKLEYGDKTKQTPMNGDKVGTSITNPANGSTYTGERVNGKKHGHGE